MAINKENNSKKDLDINDLDNVKGGGDPFNKYKSQDNHEIDEDIKKKVKKK